MTETDATRIPRRRGAERRPSETDLGGGAMHIPHKILTKPGRETLLKAAAVLGVVLAAAGSQVLPAAFDGLSTRFAGLTDRATDALAEALHLPTDGPSPSEQPAAGPAQVGGAARYADLAAPAEPEAVLPAAPLMVREPGEDPVPAGYALTPVEARSGFFPAADSPVPGAQSVELCPQRSEVRVVVVRPLRGARGEAPRNLIGAPGQRDLSRSLEMETHVVVGQAEEVEQAAHGGLGLGEQRLVIQFEDR